MRRAVKAEEVTLIGQTVAHTETGSYLLWVLERPNGEQMTTAAPPGGGFEPGARFCADIRESGLFLAATVVRGTLRRCDHGLGGERPARVWAESAHARSAQSGL